MMYCTFCGKQIADDAAACPYCGKPDALAELVAAARTGDQDAVSALYEKTYSKVYYTVKSMIKDEDAVFDIVQDTYIKAFAHLDSFQGDTKFLPWVRQIAANTARDWLKKKRPMLFTELGSADEQDTPVEELLPDERIDNLPEQVIDQKETTRLLREIIDELPEDQRAAIGMFYYEELSVKEIAAAMEVSESAVKSRLMYGRNKIEKKVRELEKQGTKLYGLSPFPFLLLLFRSQKAYGTVAPNGRILQAILASKPLGAGMATGAAGAKTAGAAAAGTAAKAVGLSALKIHFIALATVAAVGVGVFGVTHIAGQEEPSNAEEVIVQEEPSNAEDAIDQEEPSNAEDVIGQEEPEEPDPIGEALEQYRTIISQADSYEYNETIPDLETLGYQYALVQMQSDDPVPALLLEKEEGGWAFATWIRIFQYDPDTKTVRQPSEVISAGIRGGLSIAGDGNGIFDLSWSNGTGEAFVERITLDGDSLNRETYWTGRIDLIPDWITFNEIEWHEIEDLSALDSWTAPEPGKAGSDSSGTLPTDEDRIVLTGTVRTFDYDEIVALLRQFDPNTPHYNESDLGPALFLTYNVIVLDTPQTLRIRPDGDWPGEDDYSSREALISNLYYTDGMDQYEGQHITFSIDPDTSCWFSDAALPLGVFLPGDIHILD